MILPTMTEPSSPALVAIWRVGQDSALRTISTPVFWSSFCVRIPLSVWLARSRATPPPRRVAVAPLLGPICGPLPLAPGGPPAANDRTTAGELGEPFLQLLAVIVGG